MQINNSSKRNEDLIKTASFFSKDNNNKDYLNESNGNSPKDFRAFGKKKNSNGGDFPVKHSTHLTFGAKGKSSTAKFDIDEEFEDENDKLFKEFLMSMGLPTEYPNYSSVDYWNNRYLLEQGESTEWLLSYEDLRTYFVGYLRKEYNKEILVVGCGNSRLGECLYNEGYRNITSIDFSKVIIEEMSQKYKDKEEMEFVIMDACHLEYPDNCFDLIIDKGTFDCVISGEDSFERANSMISGIYMCLNKDGRFMCLSHGSPDTRFGYFQNKNYLWSVKIFEIEKPKVQQLENFDEEKSYFLYICIKK